MDTEERLLIEDSIVANFMVGATAREFYERLPACSWSAHLPRPGLLAMARECADAPDVESLSTLVTAWRHTAEAYAAGVDDGRMTLHTTQAPPVAGLDPVGFTVDFDAGTMYIYLAGLTGPVAQTVEVTPWMLVDFSSDGAAVGVELLTLDLEAALRREA